MTNRNHLESPLESLTVVDCVFGLNAQNLKGLSAEHLNFPCEHGELRMNDEQLGAVARDRNFRRRIEAPPKNFSACKTVLS